ncbi:MAG: glycosyltransferase family 4 protein [Pseudomonadota bacterium]
MAFRGSVLQVIPALDAGGAERTTVEIARGVINAGGRALVATSGGRLCDDIRDMGGAVVLLPVHSKNPVVIWRNAERLSQIIRRENIDILHVRSRAPAWSAIIAARRTGVALVSTYHGAYSAQTPWKRFYNSGMTRADRVIANSAFTAASINAQYTVDPSKLRVIPRGADLLEFRPEVVSEDRLTALAKAWAVDGLTDRLKVLAPARLTSWKGQADLIEAVKIIAESSPFRHGGTLGAKHSLVVVFCGEAEMHGDYAADLASRVGEYGLSDRVRFVGHCDDMPAGYAWADVVIAPSRRPEAFGRVAVEAGAMGKIVIASKHGGALETILDQETGLLTPPADPEALATAIIESASWTPEKRRMIGQAAKDRVTAHFSTEAMVNATVDVYRELAAL